MRSPKVEPSWRALEGWFASATGEAVEAQKELAALTDCWTAWLAPLGEVSAHDWRRFRPLRLTREEAWSDWLAHLFEQSKSGAFARALLGDHPGLAGVTAYDRLDVAREVPTSAGERRADILIQWDDAVAHIEVKVGDKDFEKTFQTARLLEQQVGHGRAWSDFILIPPADVSLWRDVAESRPSGFRHVREISWSDVAGALRHSLRRQDESVQWRTWTHSFCGAVEQKLLGCVPQGKGEWPGSAIQRLALASAQIEVMKRGVR